MLLRRWMKRFFGPVLLNKFNVNVAIPVQRKLPIKNVSLCDNKYVTQIQVNLNFINVAM